MNTLICNEGEILYIVLFGIYIIFYTSNRVINNTRITCKF